MVINVNNLQTDIRNDKNMNPHFVGNVFARKEQNGQNMTDIKKERAIKQAMRVVKDAWGKDEKMSESLDEMKAAKQQKLDEKGVINERLMHIREAKDAVKEKYQIKDDSTEQKDTELLCKYQNCMSGSQEEFSKEELERLTELQYEQRTEYQKEILSLNTEVGVLKLLSDFKDRQIQSISESITTATIEQLKNQTMEKANDVKDEIIEKAKEEIIKDLADEAVEAEEKRVEEEEKKKEKLEEKEEENIEKILENEEKLDKIEEKMKVSKVNSSKMADVQTKIQNILEENNLISEDLKGLKIDLGL